MGLVKEPEGIDFVIKSPPLTDEEREEISEFIQARKLENESLLKSKLTKKKVKIKQ